MRFWLSALFKVVLNFNLCYSITLLLKFDFPNSRYTFLLLYNVYLKDKRIINKYRNKHAISQSRSQQSAVDIKIKFLNAHDDVRYFKSLQNHVYKF